MAGSSNGLPNERKGKLIALVSDTGNRPSTQFSRRAATSKENLHHSVDHPGFDHLQRPRRGRGFGLPCPRVEEPLVKRAFNVSSVEVAVAQIRPAMGAAGETDEYAVDRIVYGKFPSAESDRRCVFRLKFGDRNEIPPMSFPSQDISFGRSFDRGE